MILYLDVESGRLHGERDPHRDAAFHVMGVLYGVATGLTHGGFEVLDALRGEAHNAGHRRRGVGSDLFVAPLAGDAYLYLFGCD